MENASCLLPTTFVSSLRVAAGVGVASVANLVRVINGQSEYKIEQYLKNVSTKLEKTIKELTESCDGANSMKRFTEKKLIDNLLCKTINNEQEGKPKLSEESLMTLCSIINICSDGRYIAGNKQIYDSEKEAATEAVLLGAGGTTLANNIIDAGMAAGNVAKTNLEKEDNLTGWKKTTMDFLQKIIPDSSKSTSASGTFISKVGIGAPIGVAAAIGTAATGIEIFKLWNEKIPKKYMPQLNVLVTAYSKKQQELRQLKEDYENCYDNKMKEMYTIARDFLNSGKKGTKYYYTLHDNEQHQVVIMKSDLDDEKEAIKSTAIGYTYLTDRITKLCNKQIVLKENTLKGELQQIRDVINKFNNKFGVSRPFDLSIKDFSQELKTFLDHFILKDISMNDVSKISEMLDRINGRSSGGKKTKRSRKIKIQKRKNKRTTRRHN